MSAQPAEAVIAALNEIRGRLLRGVIEPTLTLDNGTTIELPTIWDHCPSCQGEHTCLTCHGRGAVRVVDVDALSPEVREVYDRERISLAQYISG